MASKQPFSFKKATDDIDFDDFDDSNAPRGPVQELYIPRMPEVKPNPFESYKVQDLLVKVGVEYGHDIVKLTDTYLPTTSAHRENVYKYLHRNFLKNPKDYLLQNKVAHEKFSRDERELYRKFSALCE